MSFSDKSFLGNLLKRFDGDSEFDINIVSKEKVINPSNGNEVNGLTSSPIDGIIEIKIGSSKAIQNPTLQVARTILHEYIHADIFRKLRTKYSTTDELDFRKTYEEYEKHHGVMGALYVSSMRDVLRDFHKNEPTDDYNKYTEFFGEIPNNDFYEALAWMGLKNHNIKAWNELPPERKERLDALALRADFLSKQVKKCSN